MVTNIASTQKPDDPCLGVDVWGTASGGLLVDQRSSPVGLERMRRRQPSCDWVGGHIEADVQVIQCCKRVNEIDEKGEKYDWSCQGEDIEPLVAVGLYICFFL